jgi:hypothetical protein
MNGEIIMKLFNRKITFLLIALFALNNNAMEQPKKGLDEMPDLVSDTNNALSVTQPITDNALKKDASVIKQFTQMMHEYVNAVPLIESDNYTDMIVNLHRLAKMPFLEMKPQEQKSYADLFKKICIVLRKEPETKHLPSSQYLSNIPSSNFKFNDQEIIVNQKSLASEFFHQLFAKTYAAKAYKKMVTHNKRIHSYIDTFIGRTLNIVNEKNKDKIITLINNFPNHVAKIIKNKITIQIAPQPILKNILTGHTDNINSLLKFNDTTLISDSDKTIQI